MEILHGQRDHAFYTMLIGSARAVPIFELSCVTFGPKYNFCNNKFFQSHSSNGFQEEICRCIWSRQMVVGVDVV